MEHRLPIPEDQRDHDQVSVRRHHDLSGIATARRRCRQTQRPTEDRGWPTAQIHDLTVSTTEVTNSVQRKVGEADQQRTDR